MEGYCETWLGLASKINSGVDNADIVDLRYCGYCRYCGFLLLVIVDIGKILWIMWILVIGYLVWILRDTTGEQSQQWRGRLADPGLCLGMLPCSKDIFAKDIFEYFWW